MIVRNKIRQTRNIAGMTQLELADLLEVDDSTVSKWESHRVSVPDHFKIAVAAIFGVTVPDLFDFSFDGLIS